MKNKNLGSLGETLAATFLIAKGYRILQKNVRLGRGEIDLVCQQAGQLVFVEVKTRTSQAFGPPEEAITPAKLERLEQLSQIYCQRENYAGSWHVEVVSILIDRVDRGKKSFNIKHLTNL